MATLIKQIHLDQADWGPNAGKLAGTITFKNQRGEVKVNIDPGRIERIVAVLAEELVETARETASLMVSQVLEQAGQPAIEG